MAQHWEQQRMRRVVVTGVGLVTPLGGDREASWRNMLRGESAVRWLRPDECGGHDFAEGSQRWFGAPAAGVAAEPGQSRLVTFALQAAREAAAQAGLTSTQLRAAGVVIGTSKVDLNWVDELWRREAAGGRELVGAFQRIESLAGTSSTASPVDPPPGPLPFREGEESGRDASSMLMRAFFPSDAASAVARELGCQAAALCPVAACATGLVSLIRGAELIQQGTCRVVLAGSTDAALHPGLLASYRRLGVLADPRDDPAGCCRPFDVGRRGFAVGEGAAVVVLEDAEQARLRGATVLAHWLGGAIGCDPTGLTTIDGSGEPLARLVRRTLCDAGLVPSDIDAVSIHGTATEQNDDAECRGLARVFADDTRPLGWGVKGAIGHLMGGAGSVETALGVLALAQQQLPPTANHVHPIDGCPLRFLTKESHTGPLRHLLKVSLGFGGQLAVAVLGRTSKRPDSIDQ